MKRTPAKGSSVESRIQEALFNAQDLKFKAFHCRLIPTIPADTVIGVRTPDLKLIAKNFSADPNIDKFLNRLPHRYYDENQVHSFILSGIKDFDECLRQVENFLPFVDNWATCDQMRAKVLGNTAEHRERLLKSVMLWMQGKLASGKHIQDDTYVVRFGIEMLMNFFLDGDFKPEYLKWVAKVRRKDYYVKMMVAWYFATALAKQYDATIPYIQDRKLEPWTHNKAIQKAIESYRITPEQKTYLKTLKV
ncbi:MAG: DNA alkylation repair protein [Fibrobacter sp.]|nr:DNA alkylation repair protein [Fibrobacter sp.]